MKEKWTQLKKYPALILFFVLIFGFALVDLCWPDREYSELENKMLQQRPAFSVSKLLQNQWTASYGDYVKQQFFARDGWIDLQSRSESLLFQKQEIGGMLLGKENRMFTRMFSLKNSEQKQLPINTQAVMQFATRHAGQVTLLLAPSASVIYTGDVPANAPQLDENGYLDTIFAQVGAAAQVLDLREPFTASGDSYLYYRTDHHWTSGGAYRAYQAYCAQEGLTPFDTAAHEAVEVPEFYGTSYSASRMWNTVPDTLTYYKLANQLTIWNVTQDSPTSELKLEATGTDDLYNYDALDTRDKYAAFLRGNNGYSTVQGDGTGRLLVIKDSYANCFVPYLTANYAQIGVVDLRYYKYSVDALMEQEDYDQVLVLYNFQSFKQDVNLYQLNRS